MMNFNIRNVFGRGRQGNTLVRIDGPAALPPGPLPSIHDLYEIILEDSNGQQIIFTRKQDEVPEPDQLDDTIGCETLSVDLTDIQRAFRVLTDDQRDIVMHIYYVYRNNIKTIRKNEAGEVISEDNPKIILQGPAGSGKSTIINFIEKLITWKENKTSDSPQNLKVLKCAFTGKAASNIEGTTLHHTFSLPIHKSRNLSHKFSKKEMLKNCILFICDEISMVGQGIIL